MTENKYVSDVKIINHNAEVIFNYLSDFGNMSKYFNSEILAAITEKIPQVAIRNFHSDRDSCRFAISGVGEAEIRIVEKIPFKTIKMEGKGTIPLELKFWIQLLPIDAEQTKMRLTLHAEMGMMFKMLVGNKLEKGIEQLADALAMLPYS